MIEEKQALIMSEGTPMVIRKLDGSSYEHPALVGRANRQFNSTLSLEAHRRAQFIAGAPLGSGDIIEHLAIGTKYISIATMDEVLDGQKAAVISHMVVCNTQMTVIGLVETVSPRKDVIKAEAVKYADLDVFTQAMSAELRQQSPGLMQEADFVIYAPGVEVSLLDRVLVTVNGRTIPLKVVDVDQLSYPGLTLLQVCTETRK